MISGKTDFSFCLINPARNKLLQITTVYNHYEFLFISPPRSRVVSPASALLPFTASVWAGLTVCMGAVMAGLVLLSKLGRNGDDHSFNGLS